MSRQEVGREQLQAIADEITRRRFLVSMGVGAASASLAACGVDRLVTPAAEARSARSAMPPSGSITVATLNSALATAPTTEVIWLQYAPYFVWYAVSSGTYNSSQGEFILRQGTSQMTVASLKAALVGVPTTAAVVLEPSPTFVALACNSAVDRGSNNFVLHTPSALPTNEPSGMTAQINTGITTVAPSQVTNGTWNTSNGGVSNTWTNFTTLNKAQGSDPTYISSAPSSGWQQKYDTTVPGGGNAVTFGTPFAAAGSGVLYLRSWVRFVNWDTVGRAGTGLTTSCPKLFEPRCGNSGENHVCGTYVSTNGDTYIYVALQGPGLTENYLRVDTPPFDDVSQLTPLAALHFAAGNYTQIEYILTQETTAGVSKDARIEYFVNGALAYDSATPGAGGGAYPAQGSFNMLESTSPKGWNYLLFNSTFGGAAANNGPARTMYYDIDQIYASVK